MEAGLRISAHVTVPARPASRSTVATAVAVWPAPSASEVGVTDTLRTASARTVTAAAPFFELSAVDVATTVVVPAATPVTSPVAETEAMAELFELQVTVVAGVPVPCVVATDADRMTFSPTAIETVAGATVTLAMPAGSGSCGGVTDTSSPQAASPRTAPTANNDRVNFCIPFPPSAE